MLVYYADRHASTDRSMKSMDSKCYWSERLKFETSSAQKKAIENLAFSFYNFDHGYFWNEHLESKFIR